MARTSMWAFFGNAVAMFSRDAKTGALTQPAGTTGCVVNSPRWLRDGFGLAAPEGMAISADGANLYVAGAASNALAVFTRDPSAGALTQAGDGTGCIANTPLAGCTTGAQLGGANAVAVTPTIRRYMTSLLSNSLRSSIGPRPREGSLSRRIPPRRVLCVGGGLFARPGAQRPRGAGRLRDGASVYAAAFESNAIAASTATRARAP